MSPPQGESRSEILRRHGLKVLLVEGPFIVKVTWDPLFKDWAAVPSGYSKSGQSQEDKIWKISTNPKTL